MTVMKKEVQSKDPSNKSDTMAVIAGVAFVTFLVLFLTSQITSCARYESCVRHHSSEECAKDNVSVLDRIMP